MISRGAHLGALVAACLLGIAACGDDTTTTASGAASTSAQGAGGGGGSPGSGGTTGEGGAPEGTLYGFIGTYSESRTIDGAPVAQSTATAFLALYGELPVFCNQETMGGCTVYRCDLPPEGDFVPVIVDAGPITISGGARPIVLEVLPDGTYDYALSTTEALYLGGESLVVSAPGSAVLPPLSLALTAPAPIDVTEPSFADGSLTVRGADLDLVWTGGGAGRVTFSAATSEQLGGESGRQVSVRCTFDAGAGAGRVPGSALAALLPTSDSVFGSASLTVSASASVAVGAGQVQFDAAGVATSATSLSGTANASLVVE